MSPLARSLASASLLVAVLLAPSPSAARMLADDYDALRATIEADRLALAEALRSAAAQERDGVLGRARARAERAIADELIPAWFETPWDFYGACARPTDGAIACGHFVSVVLAHAGLQVDRHALGRQASEHIIKSLVGEDRIARYRFKSAEQVADATEARGDGVYVVGLDFHAGFVLVQGGAARFCHASYLRPTRVLCEDPRTAQAFASDYRVLGKLFDAPMTRKWLAGEAFATVGAVKN